MEIKVTLTGTANIDESVELLIDTDDVGQIKIGDVWVEVSELEEALDVLGIREEAEPTVSQPIEITQPINYPIQPFKYPFGPQQMSPSSPLAWG